MKSLCGVDCNSCDFIKNGKCKGCEATKACPFGKPCFIGKYIETGGMENYELFVKGLIAEINALNIPGMAEIKSLCPVNGLFINIEYPLPNGSTAKLLDDNDIYLAAQTECEFNDGESPRCFGVAANADFLFVSEYGENASDPEIVLFKKR